MTGASARSRSRLLAIVAVAAVIVAFDQITKHIAQETLAGREPIHVVWTLQWNLSFNSGMAFSAGRGIGPFIGAVAIVVIIVLALSARRVPSRLATAAAGLVVGGAAGNLVDRLFHGDGWLRGSVIDFVDFQWFPIFNVADSSITVGGGLFFLWSLLGARGHGGGGAPGDGHDAGGEETVQPVAGRGQEPL